MGFLNDRIADPGSGSDLRKNRIRLREIKGSNLREKLVPTSEKKDPTYEKNRIRPQKKTGSDLRVKQDPISEKNRIRPQRKAGSDLRVKPDPSSE